MLTIDVKMVLLALAGISCIQFDDTRIVSGSWDKTIKVLPSSSRHSTLCHLAPPLPPPPLPPSPPLLPPSLPPQVWNRRTNTAWAALTLAGHSGTVRCLHLHGNRLVSGSSDRTIKVCCIVLTTFYIRPLTSHPLSRCGTSRQTTLGGWGRPAGPQWSATCTPSGACR